MSDTTTSLKQKLTNIARAIRVKQGYEADDSANHGLVLDDFADAISNIEGGDVDLSDAFELVGLDIAPATQTKINQLSTLAGGTLPTAGSEYYDDDDLNELSRAIGEKEEIGIKTLTVEVKNSYTDYLDFFEFDTGDPDEGIYHIIKVSNDCFVDATQGEYLVKATMGETSNYDEFSVYPVGTNLVSYVGGPLSNMSVFGVTSPDGAGFTPGEGMPPLTFPSGGIWTLYEVLASLEQEGISSVSFELIKPALVGISVKTMPKASYVQGEALDLSSLKIEATYGIVENDEIVEDTDYKVEISNDDCEFSIENGTTLSTAGTTTIIVTYDDYTTSFNIYICAVSDETTFTWDGVSENDLTLLTAKPNDWDTTWHQYYESDGQGGYKPAGNWNPGSAADYHPEWATNTYYKATNAINVNVTQYATQQLFLVQENVIPGPNQQASSITAKIEDIGYRTSEYTETKETPYNSNDYFYYWHTSSSYIDVICVTKPNTQISAFGGQVTLSKPGIYFVYWRNQYSANLTKELKFNA